MNVLHKGLLLQDWVFRLGISRTFCTAFLSFYCNLKNSLGMPPLVVLRIIIMRKRFMGKYIFRITEHNKKTRKFLSKSIIQSNISSVVEFQRLWVLKSKIFAQESTCSKKSYDDLRFVKKCRNRTFRVNFLCQKSTKFFQKKIHLKISI